MDGAAQGAAEGDRRSVAESTATKGETASRDERDRERWTKLKRLKQAFHVKRRKGRVEDGGGGKIGGGEATLS